MPHFTQKTIRAKCGFSNEGGFYKCALSDFEIVFEDKLKVGEWSVAGYVTETTCNLPQKESKRWQNVNP